MIKADEIGSQFDVIEVRSFSRNITYVVQFFFQKKMKNE